jgi:hypothetical protein
MARPKKTVEKKPSNEQVNKWHSRLEAAEKRRDRVGAEYGWKDFLNEFKGKWTKLPSGIGMVPLNLVFAWAKTELSSLYTRDPHLSVNPLDAKSIESAERSEIVLNDIWRRKKAKLEIKRCIMDGKLVGHAWAKVGYTGKFNLIEDASGNQVDQVEEEDFFLYRVPWKHVTFNPEATNVPFDCRWVAHEYYQPTEALKQKYPNLSQQFRGCFLDGINRADQSTNPAETGSTEMSRCWEVWDKEGQQVLVIAEGVAEFLEQKPWPYKKLKSFPFSFLNFNFVNDESYGVPDCAMAEQQVLELTKLDYMIMDHVKKNNRQMITKEGNFTPESKKAYQDGESGVLLEAQDPAAIAPVPYATVQQDIYPLREIIKENINNVLGQTANERGAMQKTNTRSLGELARIQQGAENRRSEQVDVLEDFIEDLASKLLAIKAELGDKPEFARTPFVRPGQMPAAVQNRPSAQGPDATTSEKGFTYTKDDLQGDFNIEVKSGSTLPLNRENKMSLVEMLLPYAEPLGLMPGGPMAAAVAKFFFNEIDVPEFKMALEDEAQAQAQAKQAAAQQAQQQQELMAGQQAAEIQIKAENSATKQAATQLKAVEIFKGDQPKPLSEVKPK